MVPTMVTTYAEYVCTTCMDHFGTERPKSVRESLSALFLSAQKPVKKNKMSGKEVLLGKAVTVSYMTQTLSS
jgi:hypothetical protein